MTNMTLKELAQEIKTIKENHLAHIEQDVSKLERRVESIDGRIWAVLVILVGSVIGFIFKGLV
jgi:hypothetical protein